MTKFCDTTNFTLCVLLESIDLMLLTFTRRAHKAIGSLGNYSGIANWMENVEQIGNHAIGKANASQARQVK